MVEKIIEIKKLEYSYPDGTEALKDVSLDIFEGESLGIIGPNGAGKTTLLLHLNGILKGNSYVKILDWELKEKNLPYIRNKVGLVFQDPDDQLFMPTVFDDVAFGPINMGLDEEKVKHNVLEALGAVDMQDSINHLAHHLSAGEKKRISIATVLSMEPEILVLDEPSSNLDPKAREHLIELLKELNLTKIIAGHDLELILDTCRRVVVLDGGEIIADGDVIEILSDKLLMEQHGLKMPLSLKFR